jgi:cation:H+ antiporter
MRVVPNGSGKGKKPKGSKVHQINRLSLLLTLTAVLFFIGAVWALARHGGPLFPKGKTAGNYGQLNFGDGLVLVGLFLFWQCFHVFDVMKVNVRQSKSFSWMLIVELALLAVGAYATYVSVDWLVAWILKKQTGFISAKYLGWLSGWLMVLPNALLAVYYAWTKRPEVVYTSQVGDGHICIPLCLGLYALYHPLVVPALFKTGATILVGATLVHFFFVALFGYLPRFMGAVLVAAYGYFLYKGLLQ